MPELKHTSGEWRIETAEDGRNHAISAFNISEGEEAKTYNWHELATIYNHKDHIEMAEANAKLIAAAPELLEALQNLAYELTGDQESEYDLEKGLGKQLLNKVLSAKAAIAKATE